jgi:ubiquinone biosynthesis accessory factor UbiJ
MFGIPSAASINHLLRGAPWALEKLAGHSGKTVEAKFGPIPLRFAIQPDGELRVAGSDQEPDVTIDIPPALVMRAMTQGRAALNAAVIVGDTALAQTLAYVAQNLRWDYEEDLSKVVGDITAHRIGSSLREVRTWASESADSLLHMAKDYWTEERPTIAKSEEIDVFVESVDKLRDAIARLEKRIEIFEKNARRN